MTSKNVIIVGAGLFGSIAATLARKRGHTVTVIDNAEKYSASKASGCVLAPSWLNSLDSRQIEGAMDVLQSLYTVEEIKFPVGLAATFKAKRVNPDKILVKPDIKAAVLLVEDGKVKLEDGRILKGIVLVAAGIWSQNLVAMPVIRGLYGASIRFKGAQLKTPHIKVYQPYRQAVAINLDSKTVWFGDGTALVAKTWLKEENDRLFATAARALEQLKGNLTNDLTRQMYKGARPYVEGYKAGYFERVHPKTWVSTGGAKNGTVLAAWQALQFANAL